MDARRWMRAISRCVPLALLFVLLSVSAAAWAQGRPGGGGGGGGGAPGGGMGPGSGGMGPPPGSPGSGPNGCPGPRSMPPPGSNTPQGETASTMRGGLQLGPPGRWWDDKHFSKQLQLRPEQQHKMDAIFEANRSALLTRYQTLQQEEGRMAALTKVAVPNEDQLFAQIDRVAQARADLEKANTHYLLQIRREMDAEQIGRLEEHR